MNYLLWIGAGLVGGLAGAAIWAGIGYAGYEIGWIAWGIGAVVGIMVRTAAGEKEEGAMPGLVAAAVAIGSVVLGKFATVWLHVANLMSGSDLPPLTPQEMIVSMADDIIRDRHATGTPVVFPNGKTLETAESQADYPADVWQQASAKWNAIPAADQPKKMGEELNRRKAMIAGKASSVRSEAFFASFGILDALWFFLAAGTAYRLGAGNASDD